MEQPEISPGQWIRIGAKTDPGVSAVVCNVREDAVEIVYMDQRKQAINEDVRWLDDHWEFANSGAVGGYADKYERLRDYVAILRRGPGR